MKIGFYNPYFDSYGGGERYVLTLASYWSKRHDVHIFWDDKEMLSKAKERFGLDVSKLTCIPNVFAKKNILEKLLVSASYDLMFFLSDGSIPTSLAKRNILHFQVPFSDIRMNSWKARRYNMIVCNSEFTRKHIHCPYDIPMTVIYPPVDTDAFYPAKKTKTILTVGRFNALYEAKKQEILLNAFITLSKKNEAKGWRFILAGSALPSDKEYVNRLQKLAKNYPVDFFVNQPLAVLQRLYSTASLYWHGAGYGEQSPERMEHFGMSTVESMAAGCIPIVYHGGGQPEIVSDGKNGYTWKTIDELLKKTEQSMILSTKNKTMVEEAKKTTQRFSKEAFTHEFDLILKRICG